MRILVLYASTEGQTRKIARFVVSTLCDLGHGVELLPAADATSADITSAEAVVIAASVHAHRYQDSVTGLVAGTAPALADRPAIFLSVSLTAAGNDLEDWKGLNQLVNGFKSDTGWHPDRVIHVAGAFRFTEYDFLRYWAMRWIASQKDPTVEGRDHEYTDWAGLRDEIEDWARGLAGQPS